MIHIKELLQNTFILSNQYTHEYCETKPKTSPHYAIPSVAQLLNYRESKINHNEIWQPHSSRPTTTKLRTIYVARNTLLVYILFYWFCIPIVWYWCNACAIPNVQKIPVHIFPFCSFPAKMMDMIARCDYRNRERKNALCYYFISKSRRRKQ